MDLKAGVPLSDDDSIEAQWSKYKIPIISLVTVVVLGVVGYGLFSNHKENKMKNLVESLSFYSSSRSQIREWNL